MSICPSIHQTAWMALWPLSCHLDSFSASCLAFPSCQLPWLWLLSDSFPLTIPIVYAAEEVWRKWWMALGFICSLSTNILELLLQSCSLLIWSWHSQEHCTSTGNSTNGMQSSILVTPWANRNQCTLINLVRFNGPGNDIYPTWDVEGLNRYSQWQAKGQTRIAHWKLSRSEYNIWLCSLMLWHQL